MKRPYRSFVLLFLFFFLTLHPMEEIHAAPPDYLKSVTYFSDAWPINFWSTESPNLDAELQQIVDDGFNSIILVIPWREFQPSLDAYTTYNPYAMTKLNRMMQAADAHNLWVTARIGYTWDYYDVNADVLKRYEAVLSDENVQIAWRHYAETMYHTLSAYPNFYGGFLTWEDFWNFTENLSGLSGRSARQKKAQSCGYTEYLQKRYQLDELSCLYGETIREYRNIYLPSPDQAAAKLFYEFYDDFLNTFLSDTQEVFPGLSMEARLDQEPLCDENGEQYYYNHSKTYSCGEAAYTGAMISVAMGQQNKGELVSAESAVSAINGYLTHVRGLNEGKKLYIEQFLYMDNTVGFSHNAQILPEQVPAYILGMEPVLAAHSMGYGLWLYRNYVNNQIYNPQFALGTGGWSCTGNVQIEEIQGTPMALLKNGAGLRQRLNGDMRGRKSKEAKVRFRACSVTPCNLDIYFGAQKETIQIQADQVYEVFFFDAVASEVRFQSRGELYLDDIHVYNHMQEARLYDLDNQPLDCIAAFRKMNQQL